MIDWLLGHIDRGRVHDLGRMVSWHARGMVLVWAILVPLGIISARYFKVMPGQDWPRRLDNRAWWIAHRVFQYSAGLTMLLSLGLILANNQSPRSLMPSFWLRAVLVLVVSVVTILTGLWQASAPDWIWIIIGG
jgi:hypothetical protein